MGFNIGIYKVNYFSKTAAENMKYVHIKNVKEKLDMLESRVQFSVISLAVFTDRLLLQLFFFFGKGLTSDFR